MISFLPTFSPYRDVGFELRRKSDVGSGTGLSALDIQPSAFGFRQSRMTDVGCQMWPRRGPIVIAKNWKVIPDPERVEYWLGWKTEERSSWYLNQNDHFDSLLILHVLLYKQNMVSKSKDGPWWGRF